MEAEFGWNQEKGWGVHSILLLKRGGDEILSNYELCELRVEIHPRKHGLLGNI